MYNTTFRVGSSDNFYEDLSNVKYKFQTNPSLGFDFGIVYEYRPNWKDYTYEMDGVTNIWRKNQDKYLLRVGISVTDLGGVRYNRHPESRDFYANYEDIPIGSIGFTNGSRPAIKPLMNSWLLNAPSAIRPSDKSFNNSPANGWPDSWMANIARLL